ncbi:MAG: site-2 protease family protein [Chloracidobacterium sp.]|nr:site-2 protease family protein [Chloracidobacterium sp.]MDW8218577.1 site-2 protease family protein [Acidobacteriota bacterium]
MRDIHLGNIVLGFVAFLFSLCVHEFAHAWTSERFGDDTGRYQGRVTLDPRAHIDPIGSILFPLIGLLTGGFIFGWAKPVEVNPSRWKNKVVANITVSAAGPISNLLLALGATLTVKLLLVGVGMSREDVFGFFMGADLSDAGALFGFAEPVLTFLWMMIVINLLLAVFNMIPIPPLDGSHILSSLLSVVSVPLMEAYESLRPYGFLLLLIASFTGLLALIYRPIVKLFLGLLVSLL